jgi:hypothetical protein
MPFENIKVLAAWSKMKRIHVKIERTKLNIPHFQITSTASKILQEMLNYYVINKFGRFVMIVLI